MIVKVVSARSALLSNYEVLVLLKELESDQLARQKTALRIKKEEEERTSNGVSDTATIQSSAALQEGICENLRTVEFEVGLAVSHASQALTIKNIGNPVLRGRISTY